MGFIHQVIGWLASLWHKAPAPAPAPPVPTPVPVPPPPPPVVPTFRQVMLDRHNELRKQHGLPPLAMDDRLNASAQKHSDCMAKIGRLSHFGIGDGTPWSRMEAEGYKWSRASENIAEGQRDGREASDDWMGDRGHRDNVLGSTPHVGFGMAADRAGTMYWTADYASPA